MKQTQTPTRKTPRPDSLAGRLALLDQTRAEYNEAFRAWWREPAPSRPEIRNRYRTANLTHSKAFTFARTANTLPA